MHAVWAIGASLGMWVLAAGCDKKDTKTEATTTAPPSGASTTTAPVATSAKPASSATPPASTAAATAGDAGDSSPVAHTIATAAGLDSTGVPECDIFVAALKCYIDKTGKDKETAGETHDAVKKALAASPAASAVLAKRCMEGFAIAQDDLAAQGCAPPASAHPTTVTLSGAKPTTATLPAAVDSDPDPHMAHAGHCKRFKADGKPMCQYGSEYCCEDVATGEAKCQPRATREGRSYLCSNDGQWRIAMECSQFTGCGGKKCCVEEPVPGFLQTVCKDSCGAHGEACIGAGGACKDSSSFKCVASPNSRAGGRCVATGEKAQPDCEGCMWRNSTGMCLGGCADDQKCVNHQCI